jgi:hypothetical protein
MCAGAETISTDDAAPTSRRVTQGTLGLPHRAPEGDAKVRVTRPC